MLKELLRDLDFPPSDLSKHPEVVANYRAIESQTGVSIEHYNNDHAILYRYVHVTKEYVREFGEKAIQELVINVGGGAALANQLAESTVTRAVEDLGQDVTRRAYRSIEFERGDLITSMFTLDENGHYCIEMLYVTPPHGESYLCYLELQASMTRVEGSCTTSEVENPRVTIH